MGNELRAPPEWPMGARAPTAQLHWFLRGRHDAESVWFLVCHDDDDVAADGGSGSARRLPQAGRRGGPVVAGRAPSEARRRIRQQRGAAAETAPRGSTIEVGGRCVSGESRPPLMSRRDTSPPRVRWERDDRRPTAQQTKAPYSGEDEVDIDRQWFGALRVLPLISTRAYRRSV